ncbi:hypothetical protein CR513_60024, partial [Mucuna pruriens]
MKHPTKDHSLFGIDMIEELVEEYFQLDNYSEEVEELVESSSCSKADHNEVLESPDSEDDHSDVSNLAFEKELTRLINQVCYPNPSESKNNAEVKVAETKKPLPAQLATIFTTEMKSAEESRVNARMKAESITAIMMPNQEQAGQSDPRVVTREFPSPPPMELKPLPSHLKYAFLDSEQQLPVIIASNLLPEQEDKLLEVLRQHKQAIGWKLSDLPGINPSICMHRILMEEDIKPIRQQQRRLNPTILDVVKKEVTRLLATGIIYPISDSSG